MGVFDMSLAELVNPADYTEGVKVGDTVYKVDGNPQDVTLGVLLLNAAGKEAAEIVRLATEIKAAKGGADAKREAVLNDESDETVQKAKAELEKLQAKLEKIQSNLDAYVDEKVGETSQEDQETLAAKTEELKAIRQNYNRRYAMGTSHAEETNLSGLKEAFEALSGKLPGRVSASGSGASGKTGDGPSRPRVSSVMVDGTSYDTFTIAAKPAGVKAAELKDAWLKAAGTEDWTTVTSEVTFQVGEGDNVKNVTVTPREPKASDDTSETADQATTEAA
jgi:hypothetical protein